MYVGGMANQTVSDRIGANVRSLRLLNGWTVAQLAARCAAIADPPLSPASITNIELGRRDGYGRRRRDVTVDELMLLSAAFSVPPRALLPELANDLGDIDVDTFGVDDLLERLQVLKEWAEQLKVRGAKMIFRVPGEPLHPDHPEGP